MHGMVHVRARHQLVLAFPGRSHVVPHAAFPFFTTFTRSTAGVPADTLAPAFGVCDVTLYSLRGLRTGTVVARIPYPDFSSPIAKFARWPTTFGMTLVLVVGVEVLVVGSDVPGVVGTDVAEVGVVDTASPPSPCWSCCISAWRVAICGAKSMPVV